MPGRKALVCACVLAALAAGEPAGVTPAAAGEIPVYAERPEPEPAHPGDVADPRQWPASAVAAVNVVLGTSRRKTCTGVLVGRSAVLTAAHCLHDSGRLVPASAIHVGFGIRWGQATVFATVAGLEPAPAYDPRRNAASQGARDDWALVRLAGPVDIRPLPVRAVDPMSLAAQSQAGKVVQIGYGADRPYLPSIARDCRVAPTREDGVLQFSCLNGFGYSGAPIILEGPDGPAVVAIGSRMAAGSDLAWACLASQFLPRLSRERP